MNILLLLLLLFCFFYKEENGRCQICIIFCCSSHRAAGSFVRASCRDRTSSLPLHIPFHPRRDPLARGTSAVAAVCLTRLGFLFLRSLPCAQLREPAKERPGARHRRTHLGKCGPVPVRPPVPRLLQEPRQGRRLARQEGACRPGDEGLEAEGRQARRGDQARRRHRRRVSVCLFVCLHACRHACSLSRPEHRDTSSSRVGFA